MSLDYESENSTPWDSDYEVMFEMYQAEYLALENACLWPGDEEILSDE